MPGFMCQPALAQSSLAAALSPGPDSLHVDPQASSPKKNPMATISFPASLPAVTGIGLRGPHMAQLLETRPGVGWLEAHAENYMNFGPATAALQRIREDYQVAVHGVGLSLGSGHGIDDV